MSLHESSAFRTLLGALPGVSFVSQWESLVAKVGGKVFCLLGDDSHQIVIRVSEIAFDGLTEIEGIEQAAYFAKRRWVRIVPGALDEATLLDYARESHRLVAAGLTKKLRAELGL